jgi:hypothetical protein
VRIFFSMHHLGSFLVYEPVVRELAARGHHIHLTVMRAETLGWEQSLAGLLRDCPTITWGWLSPETKSAFWFELAKTIRMWAGYLRYFDPAYDSAPRLKARAEGSVPPRLVRFSHSTALQKPANRRRVLAALRLVERSLPPVPELQQALRAFQPDVVLITPLVFLGSWQFELLRTALAEGLRTVFCVGSWDHLSSKALIRDMPHRVLVWNETQREEAVRLHGVPADRIVVTGAQCYDQWFDRAPVRTREEFCRRVGVPADRPLILYVCSALFWGSPVEAEFVCRWIRSLRASGVEELRSAAVLIRPHPARLDEWRTIDLSEFEGVAVYGSNPKDPESREDYFESLHYSRAVVGLNTSAFIEAAIVGRPVHTVLAPEFHENQEGTLHFDYLRTAGGGMLRIGRTFEEHHAQLAESLRAAESGDGNRRFVEAFVRPRGLGVAATPVLCDTIEAFASTPAPAPERIPARLVLLRWLMAPIFAVLQRVYGTELFRDLEGPRKLAEHRREREVEAERRRAARQAGREEKLRLAAAARAGEQQERAARIAAAEREKRDRKAARSREKLQHRRAKRRAAFLAQIKRRLDGLKGQW